MVDQNAGDPFLQLFHISVEEKIAQYGYTFIFDQGVDDEPQFIYSVGLSRRGWPELLLVGPLPPKAAQSFLKKVIDLWELHGAPYFGVMDNFLSLSTGAMARAKVSLIRRDIGQAYTQHVAEHFEGSSHYDVAQFQWPDPMGRLPGEFGFSMGDDQPCLPSL